MSISNIIITISFILYSIVSINGVSNNIDIVYAIGAIEKYSIIGLLEAYRMVTAIFINKSFINLVASSLVLYYIGNLIESNLGKVKLMVTFFLSAVFCNTMFLVFGSGVYCGTYAGAFALIGLYVTLIIKDKNYYTTTSKNIILIFIIAGVFLFIFDTTANVLISCLGFFIGVILNIDNALGFLKKA